MESLWNDQEAQKCGDDLLQQRVYSSRLLGEEPALVLHGGGNTSVKMEVTNLFGEKESILYVKGSGWDLATIEKPGFAPVRMETLLRMAELETLSDTDMVSNQRAAMIDPNAPNPSVEAIMHALIPFRFVDHTHTDALVTLTNTEQGLERIQEVYGKRVLVVPYVMPGFVLAKKIYEMTQNVDWSSLEGLVLMNHGLFTFHDDAKESYERMVYLVSEAEAYLFKHGAWDVAAEGEAKEDLEQLAQIRKEVASIQGKAGIACLDHSSEAVAFSNLSDVTSIATRGPVTPDHVIRTKRTPLILKESISQDFENFVADYRKYFEANTDGNLTMLNPAPRWAVWPEHGTIAFGKNHKEAQIITDLNQHTTQCIQRAELLDSWKALPAKDIFDVEYWELEQAKLKKGGSAPEFQGKVAIVTGAASGIGKACAEALHAQGAAVVAVDINPEIQSLFQKSDLVCMVCDLTKSDDIQNVVSETVRRFGGLDILISNAGIFPTSNTIEGMPEAMWDKSMEINLTSHQRLLQTCIPFLKHGIDSSVVFIASKNVPAPGPGASAYSVAKAGLSQLARVAAMELANDQIRVNVIHPNQIFDTALWTDEILEKRAAHYKMSVSEYKTNNLMKVEINSADVAKLACAMAGSVFSKTTGAQIPIDGGNDRVI